MRLHGVRYTPRMNRTWMVLGAMLVGAGCASRPPDGQAGGNSAAVREAFPGAWRAVLESADRLHLLALDPHDRGATGDATRFHGFAVLGQAEIRDPAERRGLVAAVYRGINESGPLAACFIPRHGLRAEQGGRTLDLVICFECGFFQSFGQSPAFAGGGDSPKLVEPVFDAALKRHGLPKAPD